MKQAGSEIILFAAGRLEKPGLNNYYNFQAIVVAS